MVIWISFDEWNERWNALGRHLDYLEKLLKTLTKQGATEMASLADVVAEVRRTTGVAASVKVAVEGLKAKIAELSQQLTDAIAANDPVALQAVVDELDAANDQLDTLAPAIAANP